MKLIKFVLEAKKGAAATEFALLLPFMVIIWAGIVEFTNLQSAGRKVNLAAQSIADIVAQEKEVTDAKLTNIIRGASIIMQPYPVGTLSVGIQSIETNAGGARSIGWTSGSGVGGIPAEAKLILVRPNESTVHVELITRINQFLAAWYHQGFYLD